MDDFVGNQGVALGTAEKAIDGNKDSNWVSSLSNTITQTDTKGAGAWWKLTFSEVYFIDSIVLWSRNKGFGVWLSGVSVKVGDVIIGTVNYQDGQQDYTFGELGALGKHITIEANANENHPVQLAEVEVFGGEVTMEAVNQEVMVYGEQRELSCSVRGISREMKITWAGWDSAESEHFESANGEYDTEGGQQTGRLVVHGAAINDDKTYTCILSSEKYQASESLSTEAHLLTYSLQSVNERTFKGLETTLSCTVSGLTVAATVVWTLSSKVGQVW